MLNSIATTNPLITNRIVLRMMNYPFDTTYRYDRINPRRLSTQAAPESRQTLDGKAGRLRVAYQFALHSGHGLHALRNPGGQFPWNVGHAVAVAMQQIARPHGQATDPYRSSGF